jgi:hypothetical protein
MPFNIDLEQCDVFKIERVQGCPLDVYPAMLELVVQTFFESGSRCDICRATKGNEEVSGSRTVRKGDLMHSPPSSYQCSECFRLHWNWFEGNDISAIAQPESGVNPSVCSDVHQPTTLTQKRLNEP